MIQVRHWLSYPPHQRRATIVAATVVALVVLILCLARWFTEPIRVAITAPANLPPHPPPARSPSGPTLPPSAPVALPPKWMTSTQELTQPTPVPTTPAPPTVVLDTPPDWAPNTQVIEQQSMPAPQAQRPRTAPSSTVDRSNRRGAAQGDRAVSTSSPKPMIARRRAIAEPPAESVQSSSPTRYEGSTAATPRAQRPSATLAQSVPTDAPPAQASYSSAVASSPDSSALPAGAGGQPSNDTECREVESPHTVSDPVSGSDKDFDRSIDSIIDQEMQRYSAVYGHGGSW